MYGQIYDSSNEDSYQKNKTKNQIFEKYFESLTFENEWTAFLSSELSLLQSINHNYQLIYPCNVYTLEQHGHYQPTSNTSYNNTSSSSNGSNTKGCTSNSSSNSIDVGIGTRIGVTGGGVNREAVGVNISVNRQEVYDILLSYNKARFKQQYYYKHFNMKTNILDHIHNTNNRNKSSNNNNIYSVYTSNNNSDKKSSATSAADLNLLPTIQTKAAGTTSNLPPITTSYTPRNMSSTATRATSLFSTATITSSAATTTNNTHNTTSAGTVASATGGKPHTSRIRYRNDDVTPLIVTPPPSSSYSSYPSSYSLSAREASSTRDSIRYTTTTADVRAPTRGLENFDLYATHKSHSKQNTNTNTNTPAVGEEGEEIFDVERYNRIVLSLLQSLEKSLGSDEESNPVPPPFDPPSTSLTTLTKPTNNTVHTRTAPHVRVEAGIQLPYRPKANRAAYAVPSIPPFKGSSGGATTDSTFNINTTSLSSQDTTHSNSKHSPSPLLMPYSPTSASTLNTAPSPRRRVLRPAQPNTYTPTATSAPTTVLPAQSGSTTVTSVTVKEPLTYYNIPAYKHTAYNYTNTRDNNALNGDDEGDYEGDYSTRSDSDGSQEEEMEEGFGGFGDLLYDPDDGGDVDDDDLMMMCSEVTINNTNDTIHSSSGTSTVKPTSSKAPTTTLSSSTTSTTTSAGSGVKKSNKAPTTVSSSTPATAAVIIDDNGYEITDEEIEQVSNTLK